MIDTGGKEADEWKEEEEDMVKRTGTYSTIASPSIAPKDPSSLLLPSLTLPCPECSSLSLLASKGKQHIRQI
jgi:hypothetical protein